MISLLLMCSASVLLFLFSALSSLVFLATGSNKGALIAHEAGLFLDHFLFLKSQRERKRDLAHRVSDEHIVCAISLAHRVADKVVACGCWDERPCYKVRTRDLSLDISPSDSALKPNIY